MPHSTLGQGYSPVLPCPPWRGTKGIQRRGLQGLQGTAALRHGTKFLIDIWGHSVTDRLGSRDIAGSGKVAYKLISILFSLVLWNFLF